MGDFVALHQHSELSLLDGEASVEKIVKGAVQRGQFATTIADHQEVSNQMAFQRLARQHGVLPIFGMEGYLSDVDATQSKVRKYKVPDYSHITLLASNQTGLRNLWRWCSYASTRNFYHRALMDWDAMPDFTEGIYASDGCMMGWIPQAILKGDDLRVAELVGRYLDAFGDRFFIELHTWQFIEPQDDKQKLLNIAMATLNQGKVEVANQYGIPLVVVNDNHYVDRPDWVKHNLVWAMNTKDEADKTGKGECAAWLMEDAELYYWMGRHGVAENVVREAISNTKAIAEACVGVEIKGETRLPSLTGSDRDDVQLFLRHVEEGFRRKVEAAGLPIEPYRERLEIEAPMIVRKGYAGYFNVFTDVVKYARGEGIRYGPGRGSAGGSLCAWLLDITALDPLKYDLLFERFISEDRTDFPDIDVDFQRSRLGEVKDYTGRRYGQDHVCGVGTLSRSKPKAILRDLGRAMGVPIGDSMKISKLLDKASDEATLDELRGLVGDWATRYPELFSRAAEMVGMVRQSGVHASGWIISPVSLDGELPLRRTKDGHGFTSAFEYDEISELGFIKFDFLAVRHMDIIEDTIKLVKQRHGVVIDPESFGDEQYSDPAIWVSVAHGDCLGIFQLDADLMTSTAKRLKPDSEMGVAELLAVNRPGVIDAGLLTPYIERRHGRREVVYDHPMLAEITAETYGILIYQEQLMKMSRRVAGFSPTRAEYLRNVVGKKKVDKIPALREEFFAGARANAEFCAQCTGSPDKTIDRLWASIEASGLYLFNKSHSVGYALVACWEVWLKHYYYPEFLTACLMNVDESDIPRYVRHARKRDLLVLPPDVNASQSEFTLVGDSIRFGLSAVTYVGVTAYTELAKRRPFPSLEKTVEVCERRKVNKRVMVNLIRIGAFDTIHPDRSRGEMEEDYYALAKIPAADRSPIPDYTNTIQMYQLECQLVGLPILYDPMAPFDEMVERMCLTDPELVDELDTGDLCRIGGLVTKIKRHRTKKGDPMAFVGLRFREVEFDVVVFPEAWQANHGLLALDVPVVVRAIKTSRGGVHVTEVQRLDYLRTTT